MRAFLVTFFTCVMLGLIPGYFVYHHFTYNNYLYETFYDPFPNYEWNEDRDGVAMGSRNTGYQAYDNGEFEKAEQLLLEHQAQQPDDANVWLYIGLCRLEQDKNESALEAFRKVQSMKSPDYIGTAQWYEALTFVRMRDYDVAGGMLDSIHHSQSDYSAKAKEVLDMINR